MAQVALITGSNAGIGRATAIRMAEAGFHVYASCRSPDKAQDLDEEATRRGLPITVLPLDVTDPESIQEAVARIHAETDRLDVLVNNAGFGAMGAVEEVGLDKVRSQFETNVFGLLALTQAVLPGMRSARHGRIINVSSVAGAMAVPAMGVYCASKFAVEALSDSLRLEVAHFGIKVVVIQPGPIATGFEKAAWGEPGAQPYDRHGPYAQVYATIEASRQDFLRFRQPPEAVARVILKAVTSRDPEPRYTVTLPAAITPVAKRLLPERLIDRVQLALIRRAGKRQHHPGAN